MKKYRTRKAFLESIGFIGDSGNSTWSVCVDHVNKCVFAGIDSRNDNQSLIIGKAWKYRKGTSEKPVEKKKDGTYPINGNYTKAKQCIDYVENDNYKIRAYRFIKSEAKYSEPFEAVLIKKHDGWHVVNINCTSSDFFEWEDKADLINVYEPKKNNLPVKKITEVIERYERDLHVVAFVKKCAQGKCELCGCTPFIKYSTGKAYLEVHHVKNLADGGSDIITNTVALCPNCHKEIHFGINASSLNEELYAKISRLVREE
ncbi:hypothetical protein C0W42_21850 [Photobacterium kishitanii]|uniref:HNH endonuclease n=1 Tax=Photobacterium kishitanii TaxID=318456 RepID=UPI000D15C46F|nr:HNH endonuclease signature motif containing protein [Photobacterium kishitanii]PSU84703.1 hypothetical protein C0W42_21850 [Photobacterium kishitanii]PSV08633.1 hypothetical protein C0W28_21195 [Photobacterium kishitanii]